MRHSIDWWHDLCDTLFYILLIKVGKKNRYVREPLIVAERLGKPGDRLNLIWAIPAKGTCYVGRPCRFAGAVFFVCRESFKAYLGQLKEAVTNGRRGNFCPGGRVGGNKSYR